MSRTKTTQSKESKRGATPATEMSATDISELLLDQLDKTKYRGGRAIEYRESSAGALVSIHRDDRGRIFFRCSGVEASVRLSPDRSNCLLSHDNRRVLEGFLRNHPNTLSFLEVARIR